ncbi:MAG TPA: EamA family transporter [Acidimicrobiia bacterium]|nr:EamA family transporter [Acidimicrobiia bacterium]
MTTNTPGVSTMAAFTAAVLIGGGNFVAVRFSNRELEPFWGAGLRFSLAAVLFVTVAVALRLRPPRGRDLALTATYGIFSFTLSYALMYWALVRVTAGSTAVVLAAVPLIAPILASIQRLEAIKPRAIVGAVVAIGGIVWMSTGPEGLVIPLDGLVAALLAAGTIGQSVILGKRVSGHHPVMTNAVGLSVGAPALLALSLAAGETWALPQQTAVVWSVTYLVLLGSGGLFVLLLLVMRKWTVSATAYAFVLFPVVTMLVESWLADEPLTLRGLTGALVVMAAAWFGALAPSGSDRRRRRSAEPLTTG